MKIILTIIVLLLMHTTTAQNLVWAKQFSTQPVIFTSPHTGISITADPAGNVYSIGYLETPTDLDPGPGIFILQDPYISKLDANGNFAWAKTFGSNVILNVIKSDAAGNIFIGGTFFSGPTDFDPGPGIYTLTVTNPVCGLGFICKLDANGNFQWVKQLGTDDPNNYTWPRFMTLDADANIYSTGVVSEDADMDPGPGVAIITTAPLTWNCFVSKLDANGNYVWAKVFNSPNTVLTSGITVDAMSNVYTIGDYDQTIDLDPGPGVYALNFNPGSNDEGMFMSKLDVNGDFVWAKQFEVTNIHSGVFAGSINVDPSSDLIVCGTFAGQIDFDPGAAVNIMSTIPSELNCYIVKLNNSGNFMWSKQIGGENPRATLDATGNIYLYCRATGQADLDPGPATAIITQLGLAAAKYDNNANLLWTYHTEVAWGDQDLCLDPTRNLYITGSFTGTVDFDPGPGTTLLTCITDGRDPFVLKIKSCNAAAVVHVYDTAYNSYTWEGQTYTSSGDYSITFSDANGCDSIRSLHLIIKPGINCSLTIPNVITPNGDGINDAWIISKSANNCFKQLDIYIYNRYGSLVYKKAGYHDDWEGTFKSKPVPDATYYYIINAMSVYGNKQTFKGNLTILR